MKEIWLPVAGYEGLYEVSNFGEIKAVEKVDRIGRKRTERMVRPSRSKKYFSVTLCKNGKRNTELVHRIVAKTFLENPENLPCVNHKDEDTKNNSVENLEWCTHLYNNNYGTSNRRQARTKGRKVAQYTTSGTFVCDYFSVAEASRRTGFSVGAIEAGLKHNKPTNNCFWRDTKEVKVYA